MLIALLLTYISGAVTMASLMFTVLFFVRPTSITHSLVSIPIVIGVSLLWPVLVPVYLFREVKL